MDITIVPLNKAENRPVATDFGFGDVFSNRMFSQIYTNGVGWHDAAIGPYKPFQLDPATATLHYGQSIFEGSKAYRRPDGRINIFRLWDNARRFNKSAERMAMPVLDVEDHVEAIADLIKLEADWVPDQPGSALYIRPTMFGADAKLGVAPSNRYIHFVIVGPVRPYFLKGFEPVGVFIESTYRRAVQGGVGDAKTAGNYAASLYAGSRAAKAGYSQVLWLDAIEGKFIEEVGAMNICFSYNDGRIVTPALSGSILEGITRDSVLTLGRDLGYEMQESELQIDEILSDIRAGKIKEVFGCGTAAIIAPVSHFGFEGQDYQIGDGRPGPVATKLYKELTGIQYGEIEDRFGWTRTLD
jgi:branched-chain amino acid aminotransferase